VPCRCTGLLAGEHASTSPGEIFGDLALAREEEQISQESMLVQLNQVIEQLGILPLNP